MEGRLLHDDLEGRPHDAASNVAALGVAGRRCDDDVRMDLDAAVCRMGDVADHRHDFHLLHDRNVVVTLRRPIEVSKRHGLERADRGERRRVNAELARRLFETSDDLFAGRQHDGVRTPPVVSRSQFSDLHACPPVQDSATSSLPIGFAHPSPLEEVSDQSSCLFGVLVDEEMGARQCGDMKISATAAPQPRHVEGLGQEAV
jgi:hypothetical protein